MIITKVNVNGFQRYKIKKEDILNIPLYHFVELFYHKDYDNVYSIDYEQHQSIYLNNFAIEYFREKYIKAGRPIPEEYKGFLMLEYRYLVTKVYGQPPFESPNNIIKLPKPFGEFTHFYLPTLEFSMMNGIRKKVVFKSEKEVINFQKKYSLNQEILVIRFIEGFLEEVGEYIKRN